MSLLDGLLLLVLGLFAVRGWMRGIFRETFALAGLVGGALAAAALAPEWAPAFRGRLEGELALLAAGAIAFLAVVLAAALAGRLLERIARALFLGPLSRAGGVVVGSAKGAALLGFGLLLAERAGPAVAERVARARLGPPLTHFARFVLETGRTLAPVRKAA